VGYIPNWLPTRDFVADRTKTFSDAVKAVDPNARLIGTGGDPDSYQEWHASQLKNTSVKANTRDILS